MLHQFQNRIFFKNIKWLVFLLFILAIHCSCLTTKDDTPSWAKKLPKKYGFVYDVGYSKMSSIETSKQSSRLNAIVNLYSSINKNEFVVEDNGIKETINVNSNPIKAQNNVEVIDVRVLKDGGVWTLVRMGVGDV